MSNSTKITLKTVPFRNKSGSQSWCVTGRAFGEIYQQNFPTHCEAEVFMSGLIRSATQVKNGLPVRMTTTTIADEQDLQAAEFAFHRLKSALPAVSLTTAVVYYLASTTVVLTQIPADEAVRKFLEHRIARGNQKKTAGVTESVLNK